MMPTMPISDRPDPAPAADPYRWAAARLQGGRLAFDRPDGFARALADGFFFVQAPAGLSLDAGDAFARGFYRPRAKGATADPYCGYAGWTEDRLAPREGYFLRKADQVEQFFLESRFWEQVFPPALTGQAAAMRGFALDILRAVLAGIDLPPDLWERATGGCLSGRGVYHLTFNHFRPRIRARGLNIHKDSGWVTVLRSIEPGLEVLRDGVWLPITPRPGWFIVNFGCAIEILTRDTATPVAAVAHRVVEQRPRADGGPDRFSYALFVDSSLDAAVSDGLYRYDPAAGLVLAARFEDFLDRILHDTYEEDTHGLYEM